MKRLRSQVKACTTVEKQQQISAIKNGQQHNHTFDENTRVFLRRNLLKWYDTNKRDLQWRDLAQHKDLNVRAYSGIYYYVMGFVYIPKNSARTATLLSLFLL